MRTPPKLPRWAELGLLPVINLVVALLISGVVITESVFNIPGIARFLVEAIRASDDCKLAGALDVAASPAIGNDAAGFLGHASGVLVTADVAAGLANAQVLIDFTRPEGTMAHLAACRAKGVNLVIGTTGFSDEQKRQIADAARDIAIVMAPNMSVGVNVTLKLLQMAAKALSDGYDIEIIEAHHKHKVDAPSGTALKMGEVIADAQGLTNVPGFYVAGDVMAGTKKQIYTAWDTAVNAADAINMKIRSARRAEDLKKFRGN